MSVKVNRKKIIEEDLMEVQTEKKNIQKLRIGIVGLGNLGRGVVKAIRQNPDTDLVAIFSRRPLADLPTDLPMANLDNILDYKGQIDVMIMCGGSATDLDEQSPMLAEHFHIVDSFDTHARIPEHFAKLDQVSRESQTLSLISAGWDPGILSLMRVLFQAIIVDGQTYTFWGPGVSQGHSDALRRLPGVAAAVQYTMPLEDSLVRVRAGENPDLSTRDRHRRICYVVAEEGADLARLESDIVTMPHYFADYDTTVNFISRQELDQNHSDMPHGGIVIRTGQTGQAEASQSEKGGLHQHKLDFHLTLGDNAEFTASVLLVYARAVHRLAAEGRIGAITVYDIPIGYLSALSMEDLRANYL